MNILVPTLIFCLISTALMVSHAAGQQRVFQRFDENRDGVITGDEVPDVAAFKQTDADGDGRVTRHVAVEH